MRYYLRNRLQLLRCRSCVNDERDNTDADPHPPFYYRSLRLPNSAGFFAGADRFWNRFGRRFLAPGPVDRRIRRNFEIKG